jgi:outer membrane cobalamin receptor
MYPRVVGCVLACLVWLAIGPKTARAQTDTTAVKDSTRATQVQTITVTAERPRAAAPPVTTLEVSATTLRRTFAADAYDLLRRTSGIEVHEQGQGRTSTRSRRWR